MGKGDFAKTTKLVGNGPYVLKKRERDRSLLLERRENYWREKPAIASVLFRPITDRRRGLAQPATRRHRRVAPRQRALGRASRTSRR